MRLEKKKSEYMLQNAYKLLSFHHQKEGIFKREQAFVTSELGIYLLTHKCWVLTTSETVLSAKSKTQEEVAIAGTYVAHSPWRVDTRM